ncbi:arabinogalactan O-methyltransferase 2 [Aristolochia californica]|uniref:arabinogalactan O-methyltransferase 2 n=1 Tax=Aristolochia californica TaxID=171875 RepID=UPI0035D75145
MFWRTQNDSSFLFNYRGHSFSHNWSVEGESLQIAANTFPCVPSPARNPCTDITYTGYLFKTPAQQSAAAEMRSEGGPEAQTQSSTSPSSQPHKKTERETRPLIKKLPFILLLVLSAISILRFIRIATTTTSSFSTTPSPSHNTSSKRLTPLNLTLHWLHDLTPKELRLLTNLVPSRAPCNLLVFGIGFYSPVLAKLNAGGTTVFLEDDNERIKWAAKRMDATLIHSVNYPTRAGRAFELLRNARADPSCAPHPEVPFRSSACPLALASLPDVVFKHQWDVVVVDGPSGDCPEAPGRMEAIYMTGLVSRAGKMVDVLIHDVDRMIEKWYSLEFFCQENLVAAKEKLWHFKIMGSYSAARFCSNATFCV